MNWVWIPIRGLELEWNEDSSGSNAAPDFDNNLIYFLTTLLLQSWWKLETEKPRWKWASKFKQRKKPQLLSAGSVGSLDSWPKRVFVGLWRADVRRSSDRFMMQFLCKWAAETFLACKTFIENVKLVLQTEVTFRWK